MSAKVLALDISSRTGFAYDGPSPGAPVFGTFVVPAGGLGNRMLHLSRWLYPLIGRIKPDKIAIEAPIPAIDHAARILMALAYTAHYCAAAAGIGCEEWSVSEIKSYWAGSGSAGKDAMIAACLRLGWKVGDDNQADACAIWALSNSKTDPKFSLMTLPLFGAAR